MSFCGVLKTPRALRVHRLDDRGGRGHRDHRRLSFIRDVDHGERVRHDGRTDQCIDVIFAGELACVLDGLRRIRRVVEHDVVDFLARDFFRQKRASVLLRNAERGRWACRRHRHADFHVCECRAAICCAHARRDQCHADPPQCRLHSAPLCPDVRIDWSLRKPTQWSANGECSGRIPRAASALKALNLWGK